MDHKNFTDLPEKPTGWTKHLAIHMNYGEFGGSGTYTIKDPSGVEAPFCYQYDTRAGGLTGFTYPGRKGVLTWEQLRAHVKGQCGRINNGHTCTMPAGSSCPDCGPSCHSVPEGA